MIGINSEDIDATQFATPRLELVGRESPSWFESWFVERARALIRDAETTRTDFAVAMEAFESDFATALRAIETQTEQRLLELDHQLAEIYGIQREARELLRGSGLVTPLSVVESGAERRRHIEPEPDDLAPYVAAAHSQLRALRDIYDILHRDERHAAQRATALPSRLRWAFMTGGIALAIVAIVTTQNVLLGAGIAILALAQLALGRLGGSVTPSPEPRATQVRELFRIVEQAEALHQRLTTAIEADASARRSRLIQQLLAQKRDLSDRRKQRLAHVKPAFVRFGDELEQLSPRWSSSEWTTWRPAVETGQAARIGDLVSLSSGVPSLPLLYPFPGGRALLIETTSDGRPSALGALQSLLLRLLATTPPGNLHLTLIDPIGLGQNVAALMQLADYDDGLIGGRATTEAQQIERQLAQLTSHMENVIQKYLRSQYATIEEYNRAAGEIAEPYRLLAIFDFPVNFSETAARRLLSIIKNGPRCGVYTLLLFDRTQPLPRGLDLSNIEASAIVIAWNGERFVWQADGFEQCVVQFDTPPEAALVQRFLQGVGEAAVAAGNVEVPFRRIAPEPRNWWQADASDRITAPLGPAGARNVQALNLGSGTAQHALVVGKTGSGKSTLLHTLITSLALGYSPDEVQLYLVDFKQGVEFKIYAEEQIPHARVVAIESEREFGLSVLQGLDDELVRRGERFRALGVDNLAGYRARTAEPLPRILLLIDEFQEFFTEDDQIAMQAAQLLDRLVRQGRAFGLHVLLGTQTLAGSYSLARGTIDQMAVRIALQCSDADSRLILADDNPAARLLSRPGEAIYNATNGLIEGNNLFQVAWLPDDEQRRYLTQIRQFAASRTDRPREPMIIFEGNAAINVANNRQLTELLANPPSMAPPQLITWLGDPVAVRDPVAAIFRRQSGSNLLIVGQNTGASAALVSISLVSLAAQLPNAAKFPSLSLLDLGMATVGDEEFLTQFRDAAQLPLRLGRRRQLPQFINEIAAEVQRRLDADLGNEPPIFLFIHGLQRARDLRPDDRFGFSSFEAEPAALSLAEQFETILREGPELGVHTIAWCDTMTNLARSLDRRALREFGLRVAFQMSAEDSVDYIDSTAASKLGPHRALFFDEDAGRLEKFRPYARPPMAWFTSVSRARGTGAA